MALPNSGVISLQDIATEYGGTKPHSLSEYHSKGNAPTSGIIHLAQHFYGTSSSVNINLVISASTNNYNVYANRGSSYVAGKSNITLTINGGVYVGAGATNSYAITVNNNFASGDTVKIINNGVVIGCGGNGGQGGLNGNNASGGATGGNAFLVQFPTSVTNNGTFAGGGGGGGGGGGKNVPYTQPNPNPKNPPTQGTHHFSGGGGGGGAGRNVGSGASGRSTNESFTQPYVTGGANGSNTGGGSGGNPPVWQNQKSSGSGGAGGGRGANGGAGEKLGYATPTSFTYWNGAGGGTAGYYVNGNPNVTWTTTGTRQGRVG